MSEARSNGSLDLLAEARHPQTGTQDTERQLEEANARMG